MNEHIGKIIGRYVADERRIWKFFRYKEQWCEYPIRDRSGLFWMWREPLRYIAFSMSEAGLRSYWSCYGGSCPGECSHYSSEILGMWERGGLSMLLEDTHTDGNRYLSIWDNAKRRTFDQADEYDSG